MSTLDHHVAIAQAYNLYERGEMPAVESLCAKLIEQDRDDVQALRLLAMVAFAKGEFRATEGYLKRCLNRRPREAVFHYDMARLWATEGRFEKAITKFNKALKLKPGYVEAVAGLADAYERKGDQKRAWNILSPYAAEGIEDEGLAVVALRLFEKEGKREEAVALAERLLARPISDPVSRRMLYLQVGRTYDKLGRYDQAFEAFAGANGTGSIPFDPVAYEAEVEHLMAVFSAENLQVLARSSNTSEAPVFIACMPRSGSTLVEQIIHAHPKAHGAGEINDLHVMVNTLQEQIESVQMYPACVADLTVAHLDRLAAQYLSRTAKLDRAALRIVNKHLLNFQHLPMISLLFPKARVIHIRRNRLDNCLACFMAALSPTQFPWLADQQHLGFAWRQYERMMAHWRDVLDLPILEVQYEQLVADPDAEIRRIIDFCGLDWDERCLRYWEADRDVATLSYDQVRQPVFTSAVDRSRNYEHLLGPLKEALGEAPPAARP